MNRGKEKLMTEKRSLRKKNNKGASLVIVLLTVALVGILVAIILMIVLMNFKMKAVDSKATGNFYTAESALDEIKAGLGGDVSDAMTDAYILVMQQYTANNQTQRNDLFQNTYATDLRDILEDKNKTGESQNYYNLDKLINYVSSDQRFSDASGIGIKVEPITDKEPVLAFTTKGVVLKNVMVTYYSGVNYESRVQTDILLSFPEIDFTQTSSTPNLLEYALVADNSLALNTTVGNSLITGSVYGGKSGITLPTGSNLTIKNGKVIMTNADLTLGAGATLTTDSAAGLWAKNLNITSGTLNLSGATYVANDTIIKDQSGAASAVKLSGSYYGFGNPSTAKISNYIQDKNLTSDVDSHPANYSSAVLVNGQNVSLDFSGLSRLMVSGDSYVGVTLKNATLATATQNSADIRMGESVSVKSNQIAYLVPEQYVGTGSASGGNNPMTLDQYKALKTAVDAGSAVYVNDGYKAATGATGYQTAFYPMNGSSIVYFYLTFDNADSASAYFEQYYQVNKAKMDNYLKVYTKSITYSKDSTAVFNLYGNAMVYEGSSGSVKEDTNSSETANVLNERQTSLQNMFGALGVKLITSYVNLTTEEKTAADVFTNLVNEQSMIQDVHTKNEAGGLAYTFNTTNTNLRGILSTATKITLKKGNNPESPNNEVNIVVDSLSNKEISVYVGDETSASVKKLRTLITTGDVVIEDGCAYQGLIIAKGNVTIGGGASLTANATDVAKVLQVKDSANHKMMDYLKGSEAYVLSGAASGTATDSDSATDVSSLVVFRHWKKE